MPIPLLLWAAGAAGLGGLKKLADGTSSFRDASSINERARLLSEATGQLIAQRDQQLLDTKVAFENGRRTIELTTQVRFAQLFERQIKRLKLTDKEFSVKFNVPESDLAKLHAVSAVSPDMLRTLLQSGTAGVAISQGAAALATYWGIASTGTAIGTLSGAAATNATLAALGGGALAAGGGGMAMGVLVLSGLTAAPALIVAGYGVAKKGEQAVTVARKNEAKVYEHRAKAKLRWGVQDGIERRMAELSAVQLALVQRLETAIDICEAQEQRNQGAVSEESFDAAFQLAQAVSRIIQTPVHDEQGNLTQESETEVRRYEPARASVQDQSAESFPSNWDEPVEVFLASEDWIEGATFTGVDDDIVGCSGNRLRLWTFTDDGIEEEDLSEESIRARKFSTSPGSNFIAAVRGRQPLLLLENLYGDDPGEIELDSDGETAISVAFHAAREHICVAYESGRISTFDLDSGEEVWDAELSDTQCTAMAIQPQGNWLAVGKADGTVALIQYDQHTIQQRKFHTESCNDLAFSPDGQLVLSASEDRTARLWLVEEKRELFSFTWQNRYADCVAFSPAGGLLAVAFANGTVGIWESKTGLLVNLFSSGKGRATALQFNADGDALLVAGEAGLRICLPQGRG